MRKSIGNIIRELREENELKIYDSELKIKYDHYMKGQKSAKQ